MFGGGDDCYSHPCNECGHLITVDPGDIGLSHALHIVKYHTRPQAGLAARNLVSFNQVRLSNVPLDSETRQHRTNTMASTSTAPVSINPIDEPQVLPSTVSNSGTAIVGASRKRRARRKAKSISPNLKKKIKTKVLLITNQLKLFGRKFNSAQQEENGSIQPRCDNEAVKLLYDVSQSSSVVNKNKYMFECSVVPQFKCKLCEEFVPFDHNQEKLIGNFETHLKKHFSDSADISSTLLADLVHCLPFPFKNSRCWSLGSDGLLNCSVCDYNVPFTVRDMCEHLTNDIHNFRPNPGIVVPKKFRFWKICLQLDEEEGICLTCPSNVNVSQIDLHNHPSLTRHDTTESNEQLPTKVRAFDCFHQTEKGSILCEMCDLELNVSLSQLYDHVLGRNHNKLLWHNLSKELRTKQYLECKTYCIAASINNVYCLLCGCELDISEIKAHLTDCSHCNRELKLKLVLDELPVQHRNVTCFREERDHVVCEACDEEVPLTAFHLHQHVLAPAHLKNVFTRKMNTLNDGVRRVKCVVQFSKNEVWCLICKGKFNTTNIISHEHLLGDFSKLQQKGTVIDFFANTLKHVRCLIQCDDKILCTICDCNVPFSFGNLIEHILGERHNKKIHDLLGQSLEEAPTLKNFVHCDLDELLCLDCNSKFPLNLDTILNHSRQTHSDILQKFKDVTCLVPSQQNSLLCNICSCFVPMCVRNVFEHLLGKPHNKKIANHPGCLVLVDKDEVVCLNCNCSMFASPSILSQHISDRHKSVVTPDFSIVISQQFKSNKVLIKTTDDKITCLVCQCTIPTEMKYIQTHLSEMNHLTNLRSNTANINNVIGNHARNLLNLNGSNKTDCFLDVLKHTRCLILTDDNRAVCSICSCDVPLSVPNLLQHVLGEQHNKNILARVGNILINKSHLQNLIHCDKNYVLCLDCNTQFSLDSDVLLTHAKRSHPTTDTLDRFKDISCLAKLEQNSLFCSVCNCQVPWSTRNVLEHLLGKIHNNKILNGTGTTTYTNNFVQIGKEEVLCLLCNSTIPTSSSSLATHLAQCHNDHDDSSVFPRVISEQFKNHKFLVTTVDNQVTCLLCQCTFPADMISVQNHLSETSHTDKLNFDASTFLSGEFRDVKCFLQTDIAQVLCLVCNCFVSLSSVNLSQHLRGRKHNK